MRIRQSSKTFGLCPRAMMQIVCCVLRLEPMPYLALGNVGCKVAVVTVVDSEEARGASVELGVGVIRGV